MSFDSGRLSHAYITDRSLADTIAMAVVCSERGGSRPCKTCAHCSKASRRIHPDITIVGKIDNKHIISVDQIRELKQDVFIVPNDSAQKAYIIEDADSMNMNAQNAFLQILEEPPAHAVFILCAENPLALLPTVRSRCVELKLQPLDDNAAVHTDHEAFDKIEELVSDFIEALLGDNVKLMDCMFRLDKLDKMSFSDFIAMAREQIVLLLRESAASKNRGVCKTLINADIALIKAAEMLNLNVSTGHVSGFICASLLK